jgi:predicted nuclease of predicted toxin-antitoxin system
MRDLVDENMSSRRLAARLQAERHDVVMAGHVGLLAATDPRVMIRAIAENCPVLKRDYDDFTDLHDLIMAADGHHPGILAVRFDNDPRRNLTDRGIAEAITNLESSGAAIPDQVQVLNHWR